MTTSTPTSPPTSRSHPLDEALQLAASAPGQYQGQTHQGYWNMVGPYGGITAATLMQAVLQHPECLGEPVSLTVNYAGPVAPGAFTVQATPVRTNRSTQHWTITLSQTAEDGSTSIATTATAMTALRRPTWGANDMPMPEVPAPSQCPAVPPGFGVPWLERYEMRPISGGVPTQWDGSQAPSLSQLWMRDAPARPLDFCALTAMADLFFPRVWLRRALRVPAGTVTFTVYFHASAQELAQVGDGYLLGQARGQEFRNGFFDQTAQLWSASGTLLVSSHQLVYYKE